MEILAGLRGFFYAVIAGRNDHALRGKLKQSSCGMFGYLLREVS
mgnify:CR=1